MNTVQLVFLFILIVPIAILMTAMPYLTRRTISFGVSISADNFNHPDLRTMRRYFARWNGAVGAIIIAVLLGLMPTMAEEPYMIAILIASGVLMLNASVSYLFYYGRMKKLKSELKWDEAGPQIVAVDTKFHSRKLIFSNYWFIIHIVFMLVSVIFVLIKYDQIPQTLVLQYDLQGNPTNVVEKSYMGLLFPNAMQVFMIALFLFINAIIMRSKQQIHASNPQVSMEQNIAFRRRWSFFMIVMGFMMVFLFSFIQWAMIFSYSYTTVMAVTLAIPGLTLLGTIVLSFNTGQGGGRIRPKQSSATETTSDTQVDDDRYWKLGVIYFNPQDPSLFVEKRMGVGWTINFARPLALFILAVPLVITVVMLILSYRS